jgi:hypothetical protein
MLGESTFRPTTPAEKEGQETVILGQKRKVDELSETDASLADNGDTLDKKMRTSCTTLRDKAVPTLIAVTEDHTEVAHDNAMVSCGTAILLATENQKRDLDLESHVLEVPA